jgi:hypothetical protein
VERATALTLFGRIVNVASPPRVAAPGAAVAALPHVSAAPEGRSNGRSLPIAMVSAESVIH